MWILIWIIQSFFSAIWMIFSKKVLVNKQVWNNIQTLLSRFYHLIIIWCIFLLWFLNNNIKSWDLNINDFLLLILATLWLYITYPLRRTAYSNEKISVLQPYAMLFQVFPIIIWFIFIASERNNFITFLSALIASAIVIFSNINFKTFKINKYCLMILISSIIKSFQVFSVIFFLSKINPASYYFLESIIVIIIAILLILFNKEFGELKLLTKKYSKLLIFTNTVAIISILLSLTMYSTLWVVVTSLIGLLYLIFIYILWYFLLKDVPTKKDIIITILVSAFIVLGLLFKN